MPFISLGPAPAWAVCVATGGANPTIVCTGIDDNGIQETGDFDDFTIEDGAAVSRGDAVAGFVVGTTGNVDAFRNDGTITGLAFAPMTGVDLGSVGAGGFINTGTITAFGAAAAVVVNNDITGHFLNSGTLEGVDGLQVQGNLASLTNTNIIEGFFGDAIDVDGTIGALTNSGLLSGWDDGVDADTVTSLTNTGTIFAGDDGVEANTITSLTNSGLIDGLEEGVDATLITSLTNSGTIFGGFAGIAADNIGTIVNDGVLEGGRFEGVFADDDIGTIINNGTILGGDDAIEADNIDAVINTGLIDGLDDGIDVDGGDPNDPTSVIGSIVNHGTILGDDDGIDVGTLTSLINTGSIIGGFVGAPDSSGIAAAAITDLVNSGVIMTGGDITDTTTHAIEERGDGATNLTLNAGSILIGRVDLGGGPNTLNIGPGLSLNSTFEGDNTGELPALGNTSSALIAFLDDTTGTPNTRQVVAVDRAVFETLDETVFDLLAGINGALEEETLSTNGFASGDMPQEEERWRLAVFGGYSHEDLSGDPHDVDHWSTGVLAGFELGTFAGHELELFGGIGFSNAEAEDNAHELQTLSLFAGVDGWRDLADYDVSWGLTTGVLFNQAERSVANNLVAGGLERAKADYTGFFLSPDIEVSTQVANSLAGTDLFGWTTGSFFEPTLALQYTGVFANGYTETGTTNPLTLDSRTLHLGSARGTVTLPFERMLSSGQQATLRLTLGAELRAQLGDDSLTGTLLGQSVSTSLDEDRFDFAAIAGLDYEQSLSNSLSAFARAETRIEIDGSFGVQAQIGLRGSF
ncbi:MAG: autotransporter domain-containing protein [Cohaesibacteraceae bacterium]